MKRMSDSTLVWFAGLCLIDRKIVPGRKAALHALREVRRRGLLRRPDVRADLRSCL